MNSNSNEFNGKFEETVSSFCKFVKNLPAHLAAAVKPQSAKAASFIEKIDIDSPVILTFAFICFIVHVITSLVYRDFSLVYFSVLTFNSRDFRLFSILTLFKEVSHVFGHSSWDHITGNLVHILLVGPACEAEYGAASLIKIILLTSLTSGLAHHIVGISNSSQLGASGIVFMLILLNSLLNTKAGKIPLTFIIQGSIWIWKEVISGLLQQLFHKDATSHHAHLVGAFVGTVAGYYLHTKRIESKMAPVMKEWFKNSKSRVKAKVK